MAEVYALRNATTKVPFYIGVSSAASLRFKEHARIIPNIELVILEDFGSRARWAESRKKYFAIEQWWINAFVRAGFVLTNRHVMSEEKVMERLKRYGTQK